MTVIVPGIVGCFACGGADHFESACPELSLPPAADRKEHQARIDRYRDWCIYDGRITPRQKQRLIELENKRWRGKAAPEKRTA